MDYIVEVTTREGKICERFRSYARAQRYLDRIPEESIIGLPLIFKILPDGSQRLVREDEKPLQWHRFGEDGSVVTDEPLALSEPDDADPEMPLFRPIPRDPGAWEDDEKP